MLECFALLLPSLFGLKFLDSKFNLSIKDIVFYYFAIGLLTNVFSMLIVYIFKAYEFVYFTCSFFCKYSLLSIVISILLSFLIYIIKEKINICISYKNKK